MECNSIKKDNTLSGMRGVLAYMERCAIKAAARS